MSNKGRCRFMKKIFSEGLLVGLCFLNGVCFAQYRRELERFPIILAQKQSLNIQERINSNKAVLSFAKPILSKVSNTNSAYLIDTVIEKTSWGDSRYSYGYDANGRVVSWQYEYSRDGKFELGYRELSTYSNKTKTKVVERWNNGKWNLDSRDNSTYDNYGNEVFYLSEYLYLTGWVGNMRVSRTFTPNGDVTSELGENWKDGKWQNSWREKRNYDSKNRQTFCSYDQWINDKWESHYLDSCLIEEKGDQLIYLGKKFENGEWVISYRFQVLLDSQGNRVSELTEHWIDNKWTLTSKSNFSYSNDGKIYYHTDEYWSDGKCDSLQRLTFTRNSNKKLVSFLEEKGKNSQWENSKRTLYHYDQNGNAVKFQAESWRNSKWEPDDYLCYSQDFDDSFYGYDISIHYKPFSQAVGISKTELPEQFTLSQNYPNPFNPETTISYKVQAASQVSLKVYDVLGREVATLVDEFQQPGNCNSQFSIRNSQFPSGVYFYRLQAGSFTSTKKMTLLK